MIAIFSPTTTPPPSIGIEVVMPKSERSIVAEAEKPAPSAIQHSEGEHEEAPDQGRDHPGPGEHPVVARSGARDSGIQIRRPRDGRLAQGRSGAQQQGLAVVPRWW
jgi:hypothetical protein